MAARRPQFVRLAEFFGPAADQVREPGLGLRGDRRLPAGSRQIIERGPRAIGQRPLNATSGRLMRTTACFTAKTTGLVSARAQGAHDRFHGIDIRAVKCRPNAQACDRGASKKQSRVRNDRARFTGRDF
jgi:hypothetical protein